MKRILLSLVAIGIVISAVVVVRGVPSAMTLPFSATEEDFDNEPVELLDAETIRVGQGGWYTIAELASYKRPEGPLRVGVQIGHLDNDKVPEELKALTANTGASFGTVTERELMKQIGEKVRVELEARGVVVDVLPATVPPKYEADAFIALHADGNQNRRARGFKIAGPRRDYSGLSERLVSSLTTAYASTTKLPFDDTITRRMTAYYAFNWPRYEHAIHPFTPAAIVETGYVTNAVDRAFLINQQEVIASAITDGVMDFLATERTPNPPAGSLEIPSMPLSGTVVCAPIRADRGGTTTPECVPGLKTSDGTHYLLEPKERIATTSLPFTTTVRGRYVPANTLPNYFWFPYEVRGFIMESEIATVTVAPL